LRRKENTSFIFLLLVFNYLLLVLSCQPAVVTHGQNQARFAGRGSEGNMLLPDLIMANVVVLNVWQSDLSICELYPHLLKLGCFE
jgi:hypothetical protein